MKSQDTSGHPVEILSFEGGKTRGKPAALLVVRPHPDTAPIEESVCLMFTQEQCVRMRDSLNEMLRRKDSWLYMSPQDQKALREDLYGFAVRIGEIQ